MTNEGQLMTMGAMALGLMVLVGNMDTTVVRAELPAPAFVTVPAPAAEGCVHTVDKHYGSISSPIDGASVLSGPDGVYFRVTNITLPPGESPATYITFSGRFACDKWTTIYVPKGMFSRKIVYTDFVLTEYRIHK